MRELPEAVELPPLAERRRRRLEAGLSQVEVARRLGVCEGTVMYWEHGMREPSGELRMAYAKMLEHLDGYGPIGPFEPVIR